MFNRLKKPAQRATWSRFKAQAEYLDEVDELGDTARWLEGVAPAKVTDFAGEAAAQDVDTLSRYGDAKKLALVACLAHTARMRARDDLAEMLCKRVASILKKAKAELEEIRLRQRAVSERLIGTYRTVLEHLDPDGEAAAQEPGQGGPRGGRGRGGRRVRCPAVGHRGGVGLPRRQLRGAGAAVLPHGPRGDVRPGRQAGPGGHLQRRLGAGRPRARPRPPRRAPRPYPAAAARRRRRRRLGNRVRLGELAARGHRPAPPRHGGPAALRGDGSPTWPRNCAPGTSRSPAPGSTPTGAPICCPGKNASRCWRDSAPGPGCPRRRQGSPSGSGTPTWTPPRRWTPGTRTTPTW